MKLNAELSSDHLAQKLSLLEVLHLLAKSWNNVSDDTIHAWLQSAGSSESPDNLESDQQNTGLRTEDFLEASMEVCTSGSDKEGLADGNELKKEDVECQQPPTAAQMREALRVLQLGVYHRSDQFEMQYEYEQFINNLLRNDT